MTLQAQPLNIVDGSMRGPDGLPLSPFARFADRIRNGVSLTHAAEALNVETLADLQDATRVLQVGRDDFVALAGIPAVEVPYE